jgi:hypothetical protein
MYEEMTSIDLLSLQGEIMEEVAEYQRLTAMAEAYGDHVPLDPQYEANLHQQMRTISEEQARRRAAH